MNRTSKRLMLTPILVLALAATGCATTQDKEQLRADVQAANDRAAAAQQTADNALAEARAAREAAERAEQAARDAKAAADATNEKIDRMFKQTMNK